MDLDKQGQPLNRAFNSKRLADRSVDELIGLCKGIIADGIVQEGEVRFLASWLERSRDITDVWPVNIIAERISSILEDGIIDENEKVELFEVLCEITGSRPGLEILDKNTGEILENVSHASTTLPIDKPAPEIFFENRLFCLTGKFCYGTRDACKTEVLSRGGQVQSSPTAKTNYLVIGLIGSTDWIHSTHGRKIEYALKLREKGLPVSVVTEEHWVKYIEQTS